MAKKVNAYDFLMDRVQQCEAERHKFPTIVAVNFYHQGDLLRVVDTINGCDAKAWLRLPERSPSRSSVT